MFVLEVFFPSSDGEDSDVSLSHLRIELRNLAESAAAAKARAEAANANAQEIANLKEPFVKREEQKTPKISKDEAEATNKVNIDVEKVCVFIDSYHRY